MERDDARLEAACENAQHGVSVVDQGADEQPLLRCQVIPPDPPPKRPVKPAPPICLTCWELIVPLIGHADLVGGFGHHPDCPDRGIDPATGDLDGRWLYGEPGWDQPVVLCEVCDQAAAAAVGEDENFVILPASAVDEWAWLQWLAEQPADTCWDCGALLPAIPVAVTRTAGNEHQEGDAMGE